VARGAATLKTRKGLDWTDKFPAIAKAAAALPDALIDGEVVALNDNGIPDFSALQAALSERDTGELVYFAFDLLFAQGEDLRPKPLAERKRRLAALLRAARRPRLRYVEHFATGGEAMLESACRAGLEGIVSKRLDAPYASGRGTAWTKAKCRPGHEVVIGGWSGDGERLRSLLVGVRRGDHLAYVGRVGTGLGADAATARRAAERASAGSGRSSSPRSNSPAGPMPASSGRRRSRGCASTSRPTRSKPRSQRRRRRRSRHRPRRRRRGRHRRAAPRCWASSSPTPTRRCGPTAATAA